MSHERACQEKHLDLAEAQLALFDGLSPDRLYRLARDGPVFEMMVNHLDAELSDTGDPETKRRLAIVRTIETELLDLELRNIKCAGSA